MIILNGLGCTVSGARLVLQGLVESFPNGSNLYVIAPKNKGVKKLTCPPNVKIYYFNHNLWKGILRIIIEISINILLLLRFAKLCINISNYGLCLNQKQILYIHSPYILDLTFNWLELKIKRKLLNTYLKRAKIICVQTSHMQKELEKYINNCTFLNIDKIRILKLSPKLTIFHKKAKKEYIKKFPFEFFYPASSFPHKRTDLAISSVENKKEIGLSITIENPTKTYQNINFLGVINHDKIISIFSKVDALLFTSTRETLGLPLLEALEFELPAILPNLEYAKEIYGKAAVYYNETNKTSISKAIDILVSNYSLYKKRAIERKKMEWSKRIMWAEHWDIFLQKHD